MARIFAIGKLGRSGSELISASQVRCQCYEMTDVPTMPVSTLQRVREIGLEEGLKYVYVGHVPDDGNQDTTCLDCGAPIAGIGMGDE